MLSLNKQFMYFSSSYKLKRFIHEFDLSQDKKGGQHPFPQIFKNPIWGDGWGGGGGVGRVPKTTILMLISL